MENSWVAKNSSKCVFTSEIAPKSAFEQLRAIKNRSQTKARLVWLGKNITISQISHLRFAQN